MKTGENFSMMKKKEEEVNRMDWKRKRGRERESESKGKQNQNQKQLNWPLKRTSIYLYSFIYLNAIVWIKCCFLSPEKWMRRKRRRIFLMMKSTYLDKQCIDYTHILFLSIGLKITLVCTFLFHSLMFSSSFIQIYRQFNLKLFDFIVILRDFLRLLCNPPQNTFNFHERLCIHTCLYFD